MTPTPLLLTLLFVALVSWAIGWVGGWLARGYHDELDGMTERRRR